MSEKGPHNFHSPPNLRVLATLDAPPSMDVLTPLADKLDELLASSGVREREGLHALALCAATMMSDADEWVFEDFRSALTVYSALVAKQVAEGRIALVTLHGKKGKA